MCIFPLQIRVVSAWVRTAALKVEPGEGAALPCKHGVLRRVNQIRAEIDKAGRGEQIRVVVSAPLKHTIENASLDASNGGYVDMFAKGIIDPARVTRSARPVA